MISKVRNPPQETASVLMGPFIIIFSEENIHIYQLGVGRTAHFLAAFLPLAAFLGAALVTGIFLLANSAALLATAAWGLSCSMVLMFLRGLVLTTAFLVCLLGFLSTCLISSALRSLDRSVTAILGWGRFHRSSPWKPHAMCRKGRPTS